MYFLLHTHSHKKGSDGRKKRLGDQGQIQSKCSDISLSKFLLASSTFMFNQFLINSYLQEYNSIHSYTDRGHPCWNAAWANYGKRITLLLVLKWIQTRSKHQIFRVYSIFKHRNPIELSVYK